jgi:hypothetical protein
MKGSELEILKLDIEGLGTFYWWEEKAYLRAAIFW